MQVCVDSFSLRRAKPEDTQHKGQLMTKDAKDSLALHSLRTTLPSCGVNQYCRYWPPEFHEMLTWIKWNMKALKIFLWIRTGRCNFEKCKHSAIQRAHRASWNSWHIKLQLLIFILSAAEVLEIQRCLFPFPPSWSSHFFSLAHSNADLFFNSVNLAYNLPFVQRWFPAGSYWVFDFELTKEVATIPSFNRKWRACMMST